MKKRITILLAIFSIGSFSYSQEDITELFKAGTSNAEKLMHYYAEPLAHSLGNNMNSGWYNTGRAHGLGRFDIRFATPITFVSTDYQDFLFDESEYENLSLANTDKTTAKSPTIFGDNKEGPLLDFNGTEFELPPGTGISFLPLVPLVLQGNVGLVKDTELKFRYMPEVTTRDFSTSMYGFGLKHGLLQYIPVLEHLPMDISIIGTYTNLGASYSLDYNPQNNPDIDTHNQKLDLSASAYSVNLVSSVRLPIVTIYGGLRYMYSDLNLVTVGDYQIGLDVIKDPVDINMDNGQFGVNIGTRVKVGFISFFVDGTISNYSSITGGVSLGFHR